MLAAVFTVLLAAAPAAAQAPEPVDPSITAANTQKALDAAKAKWKTYGARSYQMVVRRSCFCPEQYTRPRKVVVRGGKIVKAAAEVRDFATVPRLFRIVQSAITRKVASLSVSYDAKRGFPTSIFVDTSQQIADEEQGYGVTSFKRL
jgi:hypothetical protein